MVMVVVLDEGHQFRAAGNEAGVVRGNCVWSLVRTYGLGRYFPSSNEQ